MRVQRSGWLLAVMAVVAPVAAQNIQTPIRTAPAAAPPAPTPAATVATAVPASAPLAAPAADKDFPRPAILKPNVEFWTKVFAEYSEYQSIIQSMDEPYRAFRVLDFRDDAARLGPAEA